MRQFGRFDAKDCVDEQLRFGSSTSRTAVFSAVQCSHYLKLWIVFFECHLFREKALTVPSESGPFAKVTQEFEQYLYPAAHYSQCGKSRHAVQAVS